MTPIYKTLNIRGYTISAQLKAVVNKSLTEEVEDTAFEAIDDFLRHGSTTPVLVDHQESLVEVLRYYLTDICLPEVAFYYSVVGDDRNNDKSQRGVSFTFDVEFQAVNSLIPTKIRYTIKY